MSIQTQRFLFSMWVAMVPAAAVNAADPPSAPPAEAQSFEDQKKKMLTHLDERIASLNSAKSCVQSAADKKALQACRSKMHEMREKRHEARKQK